MSRWEDKYNEIMPNIDTMISETNTKLDEARRKQAELGKDVTSQEYKQAKSDLIDAKKEKARLETLKPNLLKVKNILEFRKQVEKRLNEYYEVKDIQTKIENNNKKIQRRETKYQDASKTITDLTQKLKNGNLKQSEKKKISEQISKAANDKQKAFNEKIQLKTENDSLTEQLKNLKYGELDKKDVDKHIRDLGATIVKCDMACSNLMNGKKIEDIQFDKSKHKYTRPKATKSAETKEQEETKEGEKKNENENESHNNEYIDISSNTTFSERHPRFAKISNFFKKIKDKVLKRKNPPKLEKGKPVKEDDKETEKEEQELKLELTDEVMDRMASEILADNSKLEELGKNGANTFRDTIKVTMSNEAKERLAKFREDNGYRQGNVGPTMTEKGRNALKDIDDKANELGDR